MPFNDPLGISIIPPIDTQDLQERQDELRALYTNDFTIPRVNDVLVLDYVAAAIRRSVSGFIGQVANRDTLLQVRAQAAQVLAELKSQRIIPEHAQISVRDASTEDGNFVIGMDFGGQDITVVAEMQRNPVAAIMSGPTTAQIIQELEYQRARQEHRRAERARARSYQDIDHTFQPIDGPQIDPAQLLSEPAAGTLTESSHEDWVRTSILGAFRADEFVFGDARPATAQEVEALRNANGDLFTRFPNVFRRGVETGTVTADTGQTSTATYAPPAESTAPPRTEPAWMRGRQGPMMAMRPRTMTIPTFEQPTPGALCLMKFTDPARTEYWIAFKIDRFKVTSRTVQGPAWNEQVYDRSAWDVLRTSFLNAGIAMPAEYPETENPTVSVSAAQVEVQAKEMANKFMWEDDVEPIPEDPKKKIRRTFVLD